MTPDQIHPGRTYATTGGQQYRVLSITAGLVEAHPVGYPVDCSIRAGLSIFASLCVCDVTMAPESDQGEKVAQAQSQGASWSHAEMARCPWCGSPSTLAVGGADTPFCGACTKMSCRAEGPVAATEAEAIARWNRRTPSAAAVNAELLGSLKDIVETVERVDAGVYRDCVDSARAAIARAEAVQ